MLFNHDARQTIVVEGTDAEVVPLGGGDAAPLEALDMLLPEQPT
jgi:hypothetical protein